MAKKERSIKFGVYAVLTYKGRYILIQKSKGPFKGSWDLPGGKIDFGEMPEQTLKREVLEETGLKLASYKLLSVEAYTYKGKNPEYHHVGVMYEAEAKGIKGLKHGPDGNDSYGAEVFTRKEVKKLKLTPLTKKALKEK